MQAAWASIRKHIRTGEPEPSGKFLGCDHKLSQKVIPAGGDPWRDYAAEECRKHCQVGSLLTLHIIEYVMEEFLRSCVTKYCELANIEPGKLGKAETQFIDEVKADKEWHVTNTRAMINNRIKRPKLKNLKKDNSSPSLLVFS